MNSVQSDFLQAVVPAAQRSQRATRVPASITIAQAILESGWGQSALARECNNYFGIKAAAGAAPALYKEFPTTEFVDGQKKTEMAPFAKYASPDQSFYSHAALLSCSQRYKPAMAHCDDPAQFALQLQECGYSTLEDGNGHKIYAQRLMSLVTEFDLTQYDVPPDPPAQAQEKVA